MRIQSTRIKQKQLFLNNFLYCIYFPYLVYQICCPETESLLSQIKVYPDRSIGIYNYVHFKLFFFFIPFDH